MSQPIHCTHVTFQQMRDPMTGHHQTSTTDIFDSQKTNDCGCFGRSNENIEHLICWSHPGCSQAAVMGMAECMASMRIRSF